MPTCYGLDKETGSIEKKIFSGARMQKHSYTTDQDSLRSMRLKKKNYQSET